MKFVHWQKWRSLRYTAKITTYLTLTCLLVLVNTIFLPARPVQAQPTILPSSLPQARVDVSYTATLVAAPVTCPCTWTITSGSLPSGLSLNATTGTISGSPTTAGTYSFFVTVTDTIGTSPQQGFFITVAPSPITFRTTSLPQAKEGDAYSERIRLEGGSPPYGWAITSGTLPQGLSLRASTGAISGTPAPGTAGTHNFTVSVTDSSVLVASSQFSFSLTIEKGLYESVVTIAPSLLAGQTSTFVGGNHVATLRSGEFIRLTFEPGTSEIITVDPVVPHPTRTDVRFKAEVDRILVSELTPDAYFSYFTEYFIEFKTEPPQVAQLTGSGWYKEGYQLRTSTPTEVEGESDTQYRFSYWLLPTGETARDDDFNLTISMPGDIIATYDTYYRLTLISPHGELEGSNWYKAGSEVEWGVVTSEVPVSGILGFFGGKLKAINDSGTEIMDTPMTITVTWKPDYTTPAILIPLSLLLIGLIVFVLYRLARGLPLRPAVAPTPQPQTTVVVVGDTSKQLPQTTREQLLDKFGELLQKYESEIRYSIQTEAAEVGKIGSAEEGTMLPPAEPANSTTEEAEGIIEDEDSLCNFTGKKLLRIVVSNWRQVDAKPAELQPDGNKTAAGGHGFTVVWARDIYNEWEILTCSLPRGHAGTHQGSLEIVYSLLNTITEEKVYSPRQKMNPPLPHPTDDMPEADIPADQVIPAEQLPAEFR
jgi:hypothetical protein